MSKWNDGPNGSYWDIKEKHYETTEYLRYHAKEAVAFALAVETMQKEGINLPKGLHYTDAESQFGEVRKQIGAVVTKAKGLTFDDASPELKKALTKEPKELRDMAIGWEYFDKVCQNQEKRIKDEDVAHIGYYSHYGKAIDVPEIIKKIKDRESLLSNTKALKGKEIVD
ncbi:MAG: hypothetical protein IJS88_02725 [Alphaproteobacteria bacterium]|nr:hypothetical protein [Alphaproteobacteria bacterium]